MGEKLKLGVIGCGKLALEAHIGSFVKYLSEEAEIVAVCDLKPERLEKAKAEAGAALAFADYRELLAVPEIEAVTIGTHTAAHMAPTIAALDAGKHVLVEKPMAMNGAECDRVVAAARRNGRLLMVEQALRFNAAFETLKDIIDSGTLGEIFMFQCLSGHGGPGTWNPEAEWFYDQALGGGVMMDMGIHEADMARWLVGRKVVQVSGMLEVYRKPGVTADATGAAVFRFDNGALATLATSWRMSRSERKLSVYGDKGHLALDTTAEKKISLFRGTGATEYPEVRTVSKFGPGRAYSHFIRCVKDGERCLCDGADAAESVRVIEAAYLANQTGRTIDL